MTPILNGQRTWKVRSTFASFPSYCLTFRSKSLRKNNLLMPPTSLFSLRARLIPSSSLKYHQPAITVSIMHDIRYKRFKYRSQATRDIFLFQVMLLAQCANFVDQASDSLEFVHDNAPLFFVLLHLLSTHL